jgi:hypothetical protein
MSSERKWIPSESPPVLRRENYRSLTGLHGSSGSSRESKFKMKFNISDSIGLKIVCSREPLATFQLENQFSLISQVREHQLPH